MSPSAPITVAISRFEDLVALGLESALAADPTVTIVARNIAAPRLEATLRAQRPRVLVLDVAELPDLAHVRVLSLAHPATRLVILGQGLSNADSAQLLAFGASAYLSKMAQTRDLLNAIHLASRGMQLQLMPVGETAEAHRNALLTSREGDVLQLLRQDNSNAEIALALHISIETVRSHARNIYRKLGVRSRRALLALPSAGAEAPGPTVTPSVRRRAGVPGARRPLRR